MNKSELKQIIANQFQINSLLELIYRNVSKGDFPELVEQFKKLKSVDLKERSLYNQHTMISSLYTFIALPKEVTWETISDEITICQLSEKWGLNSGWKIKEGDFSKLKFRYLIRRLRNGINHGKVNCDEKLNFKITDINPRDIKDQIDFEIEYYSLDKFCRALGYWIITEDINLTNF